MRYTAKQQVRIMKSISERYSREQTVSMSRVEFNALIAQVGKEIYGK